MATATTAPEFFTNVISTFLMESDMGLGTIIGSMTFNTLGVAAVASLATIQVMSQNNFYFMLFEFEIFNVFFQFFIASEIRRLANYKRLHIIYNKFILFNSICMGFTYNII